MPRSIYVDRQEFARLWDEGLPAYKIAQRLNVHSNTVTRVAKEMGLPARKREIDVPLMFRLWTTGVAREVICQELGVSSQQLSVLKHQYKLPDRPKKPASLAPDPTPEQIAERAAECRERHFMERRGETEDNSRSKAASWRRGATTPKGAHHERA
jgi:hypothetical protein